MLQHAPLQTPSLPSAGGTRQSQPSTRQRSLGKDLIGKNFFAECQKSTLGKAFAECPTLGKVGTEKKPEKIGIFPKKNGFFFNWWRPPPVSAHPSPTFFASISRLRGQRDSNPRPPAAHKPPLPLHHTITYVWIPF